MTARSKPHAAKPPEAVRSGYPPGKAKLMAALTALLEEKEFVSITTAEIAKTAGVTEGLIYKYFHDKRDLLHQVLADYVAVFVNQIEAELEGLDDPIQKLRRLIRTHFRMYAHKPVFARILLIEVRNYPDYFNSEAYQTVKHYSSLLMDIIADGVDRGIIRKDIPAGTIRQVLLGGIEHLCLPNVLFNRPMDPENLTDQLYEMLCNGMVTVVSSQPPFPENNRRLAQKEKAS